MRKIVFVFLQMFILIFTTSCEVYDYSSLQRKVDLVVYTPLDKSLYSPIIKEYEKRMDTQVEVHEKSQEELLLMDWESNDLSCDFILGVTESFMMNNLRNFHTIEYFSHYSMVIFYNTELVSYKEAPVSFDSLTEEQWKDKISFLDPAHSALYGEVITFGESISKEKDYKSKLEANLGKDFLSSIDEISQKVVEGDYYLGVVTQERANELIKKEEKIAYIASSGKSCTIYDFAAIPKGTEKIQAARAFMDFILSEDAQEYMYNYLDCKPTDKSFGGEVNE